MTNAVVYMMLRLAGKFLGRSSPSDLLDRFLIRKGEITCAGQQDCESMKKRRPSGVPHSLSAATSEAADSS